MLTQSYLCGAANDQLIYQTLGQYFDLIVSRFPDNQALVSCHQDIRWTYRELQQQVDLFATGLLKLGLEKGDRLGIWGPNSADWLITQMASAKIGVILVCLNPAYRISELEYALKKVECKAIVTAPKFKSSDYLDMLQQLLPELSLSQPGKLKSALLPELRLVIRMGDEISPGMFNFSDVAACGTEQQHQQMAKIQQQLLPDDPINIQFTSGTTGFPKGATLSHCNILNNAYLCGVGMKFSDQDRLCIPVPLYHCFGMVLGNLTCITHGATIVYPNDAFDPLLTLKACEQEKCTALHGVPTMFISELDHPQFSSFNLKTLRTGIMAGAPCPVEVMNRVIKQMNMSEILIGYGQTELSPLNHLTLPHDPIEKRVNTVGRAVPRIEVKIINDENHVVAIGQKGEVCTRGYSVMKGYWNDPEQTAKTIDDAGWLHSGDLGVMDAAGYLTIVGRIKDMVIRGGENIYPREVEEFLYSHPDIQEVQVFGVPDIHMGEEICAWIKTKVSNTLTGEQVRTFCQGKITHYKVPRYIEFVQDYPMTVTGKIQKFKMRETMIQQLKNNQ
ncbi:MAG: AMP-binding protein [Gammaproteobacteria bacterium]|nr:AMP-binding protein [Gammaproteobacteria bacterium]